MDFVCGFANVQHAPGIPIKFHSHEGEIEWAPPGVKITGKLSRPHPIFVEDFKFLKSITRGTAKITIPSPSVLHFRGGRKAIDPTAYPYMDEFYADHAGAFRPLRFVPKGKTVVLGLVTTKTGVLEKKDDIKRRIDEASKFVPIQQLALSPQCGFASNAEGNALTVDQEKAKLELIVETSREVWG